MKVKLPKEVLGNLPAPDSQGLVRVRATLRVGENGEADLTEINDSPIGGSDDEAPMPSSDLPDLDAAETDIMKPPGSY